MSTSKLGRLQYKTIDGLSIRYATGGISSEISILLLGTWPESIYAYLPTWEVLAGIGRLVAVDLPGFGHSESRPGIVSPEPMGDFVVKIVESFELYRPHAVGPDIGTPTLLYAAANHPTLLKSIVIGGGATDVRHIGDILYDMVNAPSIDQFKTMTGAQFVNGALAGLRNYKLPDYALKDYLDSYEGDRLLKSMEFVRHYTTALPRLARRLADVKIPCQIIAGRDDPYVPVSNALGLRCNLKKSKLDILECGHFAWEDKAEEYGALAADWFKGGYERV
jgi:pimeloyl-ACP methyl ester carboxylesterase